MKTKINLSREAGCSLFLSVFTCLFRGTGLTNRNFTHLVKVLGSHQGVGTAISQTVRSQKEELQLAQLQQHRAQGELKSRVSPSFGVWSPNPTAFDDLAAT